jgi:hypothetical protein
MSFLNKYSLYNKTLITKKGVGKYKGKNVNIEILIKLFDRPARKSLTMLSSVMIINEWSIANISLINKYKLTMNCIFLLSLHNCNL